MKTPDFEKNNLIPAIIQDATTRNILMQGYMNEEAFQKTLESNKVWFYSRSKQRLWMKGETSENTLDYVSHEIDCDADSILIQAHPNGPVCHTGSATCFKDENSTGLQFLNTLKSIIQQRRQNPDAKSYVSSLFAKGTNKIAQKVGEEAVEVVIEAKDTNDELFLNESADLLFHYMILLEQKGFTLEDVVKILEGRHR